MLALCNERNIYSIYQKTADEQVKILHYPQLQLTLFTNVDTNNVKLSDTHQSGDNPKNEFQKECVFVCIAVMETAVERCGHMIVLTSSVCCYKAMDFVQCYSSNGPCGDYKGYIVHATDTELAKAISCVRHEKRATNKKADGVTWTELETESPGI